MAALRRGPTTGEISGAGGLASGIAARRGAWVGSGWAIMTP